MQNIVCKLCCKTVIYLVFFTFREGSYDRGRDKAETKGKTWDHY